jgi:uncharacterized protein with GYD domain
MNFINEEIEGSLLGGAQAAVPGASPYHPTDLGDKIHDINVLVCNYTRNPIKRKESKSDMVHSLINMLTKANRDLTFYIQDLKQSKCIEPFEVSSKQDDDHPVFWTFIDKLCEEIRDEEVYQILKREIAQFNSLLAEAENAKVDCNPIVFKEFFMRKKKEKLDENQVKRIHKKLYEYRPITEDKLRKLQVKVVVKALEQGIFDFAETPTIQEVEEVSHELKSKYLPFNFVMTDEFKTRYAKFRQYAEKKGPAFKFNYEFYGQYVVDNFHHFDDDQKMTIFELDVKLRLIRMAMEKSDDHYFAIVKEMMDLFKMKWFKEVRTDQKYDEDWIESLLNRFFESDEGKEFVKLWKYERKRTKLKAAFIGSLRAARVIEDSCANLGRNIMKADWRTNKNFATYMSEWADYPFSTWIIDEVKG